MFSASKRLSKDKLNGLHTLRPPLLSRRTRRAYIAVRAMAFVTSTALWALLAVGFFETPWWCHDNDLCRSPEYPTFVDGRLFLSVRRGVLVETVCLCVLAASYSLERVYLGKQFWSGPRQLVLPLWVKNAALFVYALDLLMALVSKGFRFAPYCRIAIFIASYGGMWNMLVVIARVLPDCVDAGLFLIAYILFSVWIATSTFDKGPEHQSPYMRDFRDVELGAGLGDDVGGVALEVQLALQELDDLPQGHGDLRHRRGFSPSSWGAH